MAVAVPVEVEVVVMVVVGRQGALPRKAFSIRQALPTKVTLTSTSDI